MSFFSPHILFNVDSRTTAALFSLPRNLFTSKSSNEYIRAGTPQLGMWQHLSSSICFPFFFPYYYFLIVFSLCVCFSFMFLSTSLAIVVWLHSKSTRSWDWSSFNMNGRGEGEQKKKCPLFAREHFYQFFFSSRAIGDLWLQKKFFFFLSIGLFLLWLFSSSLIEKKLLMSSFRSVGSLAVFLRIFVFLVCFPVFAGGDVCMCEPVFGEGQKTI